jgi:serine protease
VGATVCTQGDLQVPYPSGGVLAGVWYDGSSSATSEEAAGLTGHQLAAEAEAAATHFGDTGQPANRDTQYVIVSPTGTDPDGWADPKTGYCAYHDDTHDPTITGGGPVAGPIVAFTNLPYVPDAGASCGAGTVNSPGILDGATEAASHEYAETLTDQFPEGSPPGGWSSTSGEEDADLCAYVSTGPGAMFDLALTTGTVTVQGLWSNQTDNCADGESNFVYVPSVTSFSPGGATAGSPVTISGTNLGGATAVTFAGIPATITGDTTISVTATIPTGALSGHITVATPSGTATSAGAFEVAPSITSISPTTVGPGGTLSIDGSGLGSARQVLVGGKRARMSSDTATQIVVTVPPKAVTGSVTVSTKGGTASLGGLTIS